MSFGLTLRLLLKTFHSRSTQNIDSVTQVEIVLKVDWFLFSNLTFYEHKRYTLYSSAFYTHCSEHSYNVGLFDVIRFRAIFERATSAPLKQLRHGRKKLKIFWNAPSNVVNAILCFFRSFNGNVALILRILWSFFD